MRLPADAEIAQLADLAAEGVHDDEHAHMAFPWELAASPELERNVMQHHWRMRSEWTPDKWCLSFAVFHEGEPVGCQDVSASSFSVRRTVTTGSWLGKRHHGRGIGTEMRSAVVHFAFAGLGAQRAMTSYLVGNTPSERVSAKLGYKPNGRDVRDVGGKAFDEQLLALERLDWEPTRRDDIEVVGLDACRPLLGAANA